MKKILFLFALLVIPTFVFADNINTSSISSIETNCDGGIFPYYEYIGTTQQYRDVFGGDTKYDWVFGWNSSSLRVYNPYGAISINSPGYTFKSNIKPKDVGEVVVVANNSGVAISGHAPTRNQIAAQLVFKIARKYNNGYVSGQAGDFQYVDTDGTTLQKHYTSIPNFNSAVQSDNECLNIYVNWCGDGVRDAEEQCDPADTTHSGWGNTGCTAACVPTAGSCQNGGVTGRQNSAITLSTPGLCQAGFTAQNLQDITSGTRHDYTWECRSGAGDVYIGGTCSAWYDLTVLPYSACVVGNPAADCSTNTYADQAACLAANPLNSGRVCYLNDLTTCNANRATQCPATNSNPMCNSLNWTPAVLGGNIGSFVCQGSDLSSPATFSLRITPPGGAPIIMPITTTPPTFPLFGQGVAMYNPYTFAGTGTYTADCLITTTTASGVVTLPVGTCTQQITITTITPQPTCQALSVVDIATGAAPTAATVLPFQARCTCTASPEFSAPGFGVDRYDFNMTGANTGNFTVNTGALSAIWDHQVNFSGATNVTCNITGHDALGATITTAGQPACATGFSAGSTILPYSACVVGNPAADCSTNTYADQAACLAANPLNSGRVCYLNDLTTCNANRATQCPPALTCNSACTTNAQCAGVTGGICSNGFCRNSACIAETNCSCGGGQTPICDSLSVSGNTYTCQGNVASAGATGTCELRSAREGGTLFATGSMTNGRCDITYAGSVSNPVWCVMIGNNGTNFNNNLNTCAHTPGGGGGPPPCCGGGGRDAICGDGVVATPNSKDFIEQCDPSSNKAEWPTKYPWCKSDCTIDLTITNPGGAVFGFILPSWRIIGQQQRVFQSGETVDYKYNSPSRSDGKLSGSWLPRTPVSLKNPQASPISGSEVARSIGCDLIKQESCQDNYSLPIQEYKDGICKPVNPIKWRQCVYTYNDACIKSGLHGWAYFLTKTVWENNGQKAYTPIKDSHGCTTGYTPSAQGPFRIYTPEYATTQRTIFGYFDLQAYISKKIVGTDSYKDNATPNGTTLLRNPNSLHVEFGPFNAWSATDQFGIRVAKSIVSNTSGGNAYNVEGAQVNKVTSDFIPSLKKGNFTTAVTTSDGGDWSLTKTTTGKVSTQTKTTVTNTTKTAASNVNAPISVNSFTDISFANKFQKLGEQKNVYVAPKGVKITGVLHLSGVASTIIVENGNLEINADIDYGTDKNASWAFIVKNGDIIVKGNVQKIAGVFMVLNGKIRSDGVDSITQLKVDGSFYGNIGDLIEHRTYVYGTKNSTALATGVVINYSNRSLRFPPPMLTNFIETYKLKKVAK